MNLVLDVSKRKIVSIFLIALIFSYGALYAQGKIESSDDDAYASRYDSYATNTSMGPSIIASTSWVASIVEASGAKKVTTLAPTTLKHPPEYDFTPNDIIQATSADLLFWAGYEGFMKKLVSVANIDEKKVERVNTGNSPELLRENVTRISRLLSTQTYANEWLIELDTLFDSLKKEVANLSEQEKRVIVQFHQIPFIESLGYTIVATFGPKEITMSDVKEIEKLNFHTIIDNYHSPGGMAFSKEGREYVELLNFPGPYNTNSILTVITHNATQLGLLDSNL